MKALTIALGIVIVLGVGVLWLYAAPQSAPPPPQTLAPQTTSSSPLQPQQASSAQVTASSSVVHPFAITHTVGVATATPAMITVGTSTQVTVTIQITDQALIPNSINLLLLGATGTQPTILGVMQSTGNGGYSLQHNFNELAAGQIQLQVSAAFQGSLTRVLSNVLSISVWSVLTDPISGFAAFYPPSLYNLSNTASSSGFYSLESYPQGVSIGGVGPEDGSTATTSGFAVTIYPSQYSGSFDINAWLSTIGLTDEVDTETPLPVGGVPGYEIIFKNEVGAGRPTVVVYNQGYVYQISYASTFSPGSPADQSGISAFNGVVQHFTFSH